MSVLPDLAGGMVHTHFGLYGFFIGGVILSVSNALGIAANTKENQDKNVDAYKELLERGVIPPPDEASGLTNGEYALQMGKLESLSLPNRRANYALWAAPLAGFVPATHIQAALLGSAENFGVGIFSGASAVAHRTGRGIHDRVTKDTDIMELAGPKHALRAHDGAYKLGYVAQLPQTAVGKIQQLRKNRRDSEPDNGQEK